MEIEAAKAMTFAKAYRYVTAEMGPSWFVASSVRVGAQQSGETDNSHPSGGQIFLTFDDGPYANTLRVSSLLSERNMTATFFLLGSKMSGRESIAEELAGAGHTIALHGHEHWSAWISHPRNVVKDIRLGFEALSSIVHEPVTWFRPAFGRITPWGLREASRLHMKTILWDLNPEDYRRGSTSADVSTYVRRWATPGSVVLLHESGAAWPDVRLDMSRFLDSIQEVGLYSTGLPK